MTRTVIQVECVRVGALLHRHQAVLGTIHHAVIRAKLGDHFKVVVAHLADHLIEGSLLRRIHVHRGPRFVVRHVEIEVAVPVHVGQGHRHAAGAGREPCLGRPLGEHPVSVVHEQRHTAAQRAH